MFKKILIANRGEIACRILNTAKRLGIQTVAVYSDADKNALHVTNSDESYHIGPSPTSESYLKIDKIIQVAKESETDAVHPGYGFLSENPEFAKKCDEAGIVFIGPSADSIEKMGQKDVAKRIIEDAGLPVIPGYHGENQEVDYLSDIAEKIGFPVLIKDSAGGGGKGMQIVNKKAEFADSLTAVQRESQSSFGDQRCIIEKYLPKTRHIEVQIFGDKSGNYVHLFERDCSIQRRYQKVIEEAPAPGISDELRGKLGEIAIQVAKSVNYVNAGTVEFIADITDGLLFDSIYFMEMNTRLQVEHPVTELITGQDLVEWQIRIADGEPLPLKQSDLQIIGHAIEARVYAENPANEFLPSIGKLDFFEFPVDEIRVDSGVKKGDEISQFYDPMIAKVISHADNRNKAISQLDTALSKSYIAGVKTNISFVKKILNHNQFTSGEVETGIIDREIVKLTVVQQPSIEILAVVALGSIDLLDLPNKFDIWEELKGWRSWGESKHTANIKWQEEVIELNVQVLEYQKFRVSIGENSTDVELVDDFEGVLKLKVNDELELVKIFHKNESVFVFKDGETYEFSIPNFVSLDETEAEVKNIISAEIPSVVKVIEVVRNDQVEKGQKLLVLEAMKMEHTIYSKQDGIISEVCVKVGQQVKESEELIKFGEIADVTES